jgi:hypothetical protein
MHYEDKPIPAGSFFVMPDAWHFAWTFEEDCGRGPRQRTVVAFMDRETRRGDGHAVTIGFMRLVRVTGIGRASQKVGERLECGWRAAHGARP